jgi:hypothetical protein
MVGKREIVPNGVLGGYFREVHSTSVGRKNARLADLVDEAPRKPLLEIGNGRRPSVGHACFGKTEPGDSNLRCAALSDMVQRAGSRSTSVPYSLRRSFTER